MFYFGKYPGLTALFFIPLLLLHALILFGLVLITSSLNVFYRDIQHLTVNLLTLLFFLTPIVYPISIVPENFRETLYFNPFTLLVESYHMILFYGLLPSFKVIVSLVIWAVILLFFGAFIFSKKREFFAELL
jgi:ABC-type polysaccharide/polyol phosphate export permease